MTTLLTRKVEKPLLPPLCQAWIEQFISTATCGRIARVEDLGFASRRTFLSLWICVHTYSDMMTKPVRPGQLKINLLIALIEAESGH